MPTLASSSASRALLGFALCLSVLGCTTQLAPPYDKTVVDGLNAANTEAMTLLAEVSKGTDKSTFPQREGKYNALIGRLDALAVSAGARPVPSNSVTELINKKLERRGAKEALVDDDATPPSVAPIKKLAEGVATMRDKDRESGLTLGDVKAFKGSFVVYFDQAITYENFLKR